MTDFHGAEEAMVDTWVRSKLEAHAAFDTISPGLTGRIHNRLAPEGTDFPYIVFQAQTPPEVVRGVGFEEVMVDTIYIVKAIAQGTDFLALAPVASAIRTALTSPNGETVTTGIGTVFTSRYERSFSMVENEQTKQFRHLGGEFRIQAQAA